MHQSIIRDQSRHLQLMEPFCTKFPILAAANRGDPRCTSCSFAKFDLWSAGSEVLEFLQYTCSNDIDIPIGKNLSWKYPLSKLDASLHEIVISANKFLKLILGCVLEL